MKLQTALFALTLLAATTADAASPATSGALPVAANHIVGLWSNEAAVRPCGSNLPLNLVRHTILYHAGGTFMVVPRMAPGAGIPNASGVPGLNQRSALDVGTWSYDPLTREYTVKGRFDWYVDGQYHGYQTIDRTFLLSNDRLQASGPVRTTRYAANGSTVVELCGSAVSTRL